MSIFKRFFVWLGSFWTPAVSGAIGNLAASVAAQLLTELSTVSLNILMAKAGVLVTNPSYIGEDGHVKLNALRDELARYAAMQGIVVTQRAIDLIIAAAAPNIPR